MKNFQCKGTRYKCDTQIFMSNNDLETTHELSLRLDVPLNEVLMMSSP